MAYLMHATAFGLMISKGTELKMKIYAAILCSVIGSPTAALGQNEIPPVASSSHKDHMTRKAPDQLGVHIGLSKVEQLGDPVMTYGIYVDHAFDENFLVGASVDYWSKSQGTIADTSVSVNDLSAALNLKFVFTNISLIFRPYLVVGAALHRFEIREAANQTKNLDSPYRDTLGKFGLDYGGGFYYRFDNPIDVFGEIRYRGIMDSNVKLSHLAFTGGINYGI